MRVCKYYTYVGTNGTIQSSIDIPNVQRITRYWLFAEKGKKLTKNEKVFVKDIIVPESELEFWKEVDKPDVEDE